MPLGTLTLTIQDSGGESSTMKLNVFADVTATAEQLENVAQNWAEAIDDTIDGAVTEARFTINADISGLGIKAAPLPDSDVEEGALFIMGSTGGTTNFRIPTFKEALFVAGSHLVNVAALAVDAILDRVIDGIEYAIGADLDPADSRGDDITRLISAQSQFKKERRRRR